jgi:hypothetical protein
MVLSSSWITGATLLVVTITLTESFIVMSKTSKSFPNSSILNSSPQQQQQHKQDQQQDQQQQQCDSEQPQSLRAVGSNSNRGALYSFADARRMARNYQFDTREEFVEYSCPGAYQLPKNPHQVWPDEWRGWDDWLGVRLDYPIAKRTARALTLRSKEEYMQLIASKTINDNDDASRLPYQPDKAYKDEWISWEDWLGIQIDDEE